MSSFANKNIIVVTHVTISNPSGNEVYGQCHALADFAKGAFRELVFIRHPLNGIDFSRADSFSVDKNSSLKILETKAKGPLRYLLDIFATTFCIIFSGKKWDVYVGVNSLNAFSGLVLRAFGRARYVIFYTADYVPQRFGNNFLNSIYHYFDRFCLKRADFVWNICQAQMRIRKAQGVPGEKNVYVPHGIDPLRVKLRQIEDVSRKSFVIAANLGKAFNYKLILDAFRNVIQTQSQAKVFIVGTGEIEQEVRDYIKVCGLSENVEMSGWLPHDRLIDFISRCGVGLAIYTSQCSWTNFSDSFKVKEYLGCGCPVIISGADAAAEEALGSCAAIVVKQDAAELGEAMLKFLKDDDFYLKSRDNAINFMKNLSWEKIYSRGLNFLLQ